VAGSDALTPYSKLANALLIPNTLRIPSASPARTGFIPSAITILNTWLPQAPIADLALDPKLCAEVGNPDLGPEFRSPVWSTVPTLFLSGSMDSETPPPNAENIRWGFPDSVHIIVENGFHETLPASEVQDIVVDFFKGQDVSARRITFARPVFLSIEQAKAQLLAPSNPH